MEQSDGVVSVSEEKFGSLFNGVSKRKVKNELHIGLCKGRHDIKTNDGRVVKEFIFKEEVPFNFGYLTAEANKYLSKIREEKVDRTGNNKLHIYLYITGFTPALTSVLKAYSKSVFRDDKDGFMYANLILMHYDRESESYVKQNWKWL